MKALAKYPRTPAQVKRVMRRLGLQQKDAAAAIKKSEAAVSLTLRGLMKSRPIIDALRALIAARQANGGTPPAA